MVKILPNTKLTLYQAKVLQNFAKVAKILPNLITLLGHWNERTNRSAKQLKFISVSIC